MGSTFVQLLLAISFFTIIYQIVEYLSGMKRRRRVESMDPAAGGLQLKRLIRDAAFGLGQSSMNRFLLANQTLRESWEKLLVRSGNPWRWNVEHLVGYKEFFLIGFLLLHLASRELPLHLVMMIGFLSFQAPDFALKMRIGERLRSIQRQTPGFINLVALAMESGLDFMAAVDRIMTKMKDSPLKEELGQMVQETQLGTPRRESLQHMADRINLPDMSALVSIVNQAEELGTSLTQVLRTYSDDMRSKRLLTAEETAGKAPIKILIPMMVFFLPIIFVIIFAPLAYNFYHSKGSF